MTRYGQEENVPASQPVTTMPSRGGESTSRGGESKGYLRAAPLITPNSILEAIAAESGVSMALLLCARRDRKIARPRQLAMYLMRKLCFELSLAKIGASVGGRDHKTVMHACDLMDYLLTRDRGLRDLQQRVLERLYGTSA